MAKNDTSFTKGNGGRPKGSQNKLKRELKEAITNFIAGKFAGIEALWAKLEPDKKADLLVKLIPYSIPKLNAEVDSKGKDKKPDAQVQIIKFGDQEIKF